MVRMYTYMTKNESMDEALEKGRFFLTEEDLIDYLSLAEKKYKLFFPDQEEEFECVILCVDVREGKALRFDKNGDPIQDETE